MSDPAPTTLRYVMLDTEGLSDHDLIQWDGENFSKFTPLGDWEKPTLPGTIMDVGDFDSNIPTFGLMIDGLGSVHVRGVLAVALADLPTVEPDGSVVFLPDLPDKFVPEKRGVFTASIFAAKDEEDVLVAIPSAFFVFPSGAAAFNLPSHIGVPSEDTVIGDVLDGYSLFVNLNGSYPLT